MTGLGRHGRAHRPGRRARPGCGRGRAAGDRPVRRRRPRPALRRDRASWRRRSRPLGRRLAPGRSRGRREALLARPAAGPDRAASIRARAPLRRDGADLLPARGRRRWTTRVAVYPGSFDPITNGHLDILAPRAGRLRPRRRRRPRQPAQDAAAPGRDADRGHPRGRCADDGVARSTASRSRPSTGSRSSSAAPTARRSIVRGPAGDQRLRDRDAARPQQPRARARHRHGVLHDRRSRTATSARAWSRRSPRSAATSRAMVPRGRSAAPARSAAREPADIDAGRAIIGRSRPDRRGRATASGGHCRSTSSSSSSASSR